MFEYFTIDTSIFTVRHSPDVIGVFEPVSAILFLNVDDAAFGAMRAQAMSGQKDIIDDGTDGSLVEVFWHETYHCFQTYCTGYLFEQSLRILKQYSFGKSFAFWKYAINRTYRYGRVEARYRLNFWMDRGWRIAWAKNYLNLEKYHDILKLRKLAAYSGQPTLAGAAMPRLYSTLNEIREHSKIRGADGVSAQDIIEASAFIYGRELTYGREGLEGRIHDDTLDADGPYQRAIAVTDEMCPGRPPEIIRAATSLALRYESPGQAFVPILSRLRTETPGDEAEAARRLSHNMPDISAAGQYLGTARDVVLSTKRHIELFYEDQLAALRSGAWGVDEIDVLVSPHSLHMIPPGKLGFGIMLNDGTKRGFGDDIHGGFRLMLGTTLLPTGTTVEDLRRQFEELTGRRLQS